MKPNGYKLLLALLAGFLLVTGTGCAVCHDFLGDFGGHGGPVTGHSGNWLDSLPGGEPDAGCQTCRGAHAGGGLVHAAKAPEPAPATVRFHPVPTRPVFAPGAGPLLADNKSSPARTTRVLTAPRSSPPSKSLELPVELPREMVQDSPGTSRRVVQPAPASTSEPPRTLTAPAPTSSNQPEQASAISAPLLVNPAVALQPAEGPTLEKQIVPAGGWRPVVRGSYR